MNYWLMKSEPKSYSWEDLKNATDKKTSWDGIRNYQARKYLREMRVGDLAFFYHSAVKPQQIMGIIKIIKESYVDPTQFDPASIYYDSKSKPENPKWEMVDVQYKEALILPINREELKGIPELQNMVLFKNSRLSVQPVTAKEWRLILALRDL